MPEIREVEKAVVRDHPLRRSLPVQSKDDRKVLKADILKNLIIGPLKKSGVDRHNRFHPL
jgi:hypothetical protein